MPGRHRRCLRSFACALHLTEFTRVNVDNPARPGCDRFGERRHRDGSGLRVFEAREAAHHFEQDRVIRQIFQDEWFRDAVVRPRQAHALMRRAAVDVGSAVTQQCRARLFNARVDAVPVKAQERVPFNEFNSGVIDFHLDRRQTSRPRARTCIKRQAIVEAAGMGFDDGEMARRTCAETRHQPPRSRFNRDGVYASFQDLGADWREGRFCVVPMPVRALQTGSRIPAIAEAKRLSRNIH